MILSRSAVAGLWPDIMLDDLDRELWQRVSGSRTPGRMFRDLDGRLRRRLR
jgi:hypothetical protein